ncbi:hypothetical protein KA005_71615, partial [bacterium]|nr:hypothetical protein [bacterium]
FQAVLSFTPAYGVVEFNFLANEYFMNPHNTSNNRKLKETILEEARTGAFTGPAHSLKIKQLYSAQRGVVFLDMLEKHPGFFTESEKDAVRRWFEALTKRAFTIEWSDFYYMLAFRKPITGPYRNQEVGASALSVYAEIIGQCNPDLAKKARDYVRENGIGWRGNFRNTDDLITYQASWIYNAWNMGRFMFPETLRNSHSRKSFNWLLKQWPPNGGPLGYNPSKITMIPDIFLLGAKIHKNEEYQWLAEKSLNYACDHGIVLSGFRPGLQFKDSGGKARKPVADSTFIIGPGNLVQFPSKNRPDKIVFRSGWDDDSLYALLNLRYDGYHGYKATNCLVTLHYGVPFIVEDVVKIQRKWLPDGRALVRDDNIERYRLNGFYIKAPLLSRLWNNIDVLRTRWFQTLPRHTEQNRFFNSDLFDYSRTDIADWLGWNNSRVCLLVDDAYFAVFDFNKGKSRREHSIVWHLRGSYDTSKTILTQDEYKLQTVFLFDNKSNIEIKKSYEEHKPLSPSLEANYDVYISSTEDHSEVVSVFSPLREKAVTVKPIKMCENYMCVTVEYNGNIDIILVNKGGQAVQCQGIKTKDEFILVHNGEIHRLWGNTVN